MPCRLHGYPCFRFSVWVKTGEKQKKTTKIFIMQGAGFWILLVIPHYVVQPARPSEWRPFRLSVAKPEPKKIMTQSKSKFQLSVESNPWLNWFCLTTVCDWSRKFAPISQPIKCKTKIDRDVVTRVSRATGSLRVCFVLIDRCDHSGFFLRVLWLSSLLVDTYL